MAVNVNVDELLCSANYELNFITDVLGSDKRADKNWCGKVLTSVNVIKKILDVFGSGFKTTNVEFPSSRTGSQESSYASVLQFPRPQTINRSKNVVLVSPKDPASVTDSQQTLKLLQTSTKMKNLNLGVNTVRKVRNKGVVIELRNESECKTLVDNVQKNDSNLTAYIPPLKKPKLMIYNIDIDIKEEDLAEAIVEQNPIVRQCILDDVDKIKTCFLRKSRHGQCQYGVVEVSPRIYQAICKSERLYIGYTSCKFRDYISVIRCYKCYGFNHFAKDCQSPLHCPQCSESHKIEECPKTVMQCVNCKSKNLKMSSKPNYKPCDTNHCATSVDCPIYQRIVNLLKSKINYG